MAALPNVSWHDSCFAIMVSTRGQLAAQAVAVGIGKGFRADLVRRTRAMLAALDATHVLEDLRFPPCNHLEAPSSDPAGQHSVWMYGQWRICFIGIDRGPADVEIVDHNREEMPCAC